uniref:NTF2-related export protein n=1 Tax=Cannabis sativa TaxID=3483 RepID=A0A803PLS8_CANSA
MHVLIGGDVVGIKNGSRLSFKGIHGALLLHLRYQPCKSGYPIPGHVHVDLRRSEVPRGPEHCRQARSLPFEQYKHNISIVDFQPSGPAGGMLVFVNDNFQLAGEQHALKFSQMFDLMPTPQGSFYVFNGIFLLNYA